MIFTLKDFKEVYKSKMICEEYLNINQNFENEEYREFVASKMLKAVIEDTHKSDWLSRNDAMRRAAKHFGLSNNKKFRELIQEMAKSS